MMNEEMKIQDDLTQSSISKTNWKKRDTVTKKKMAEIVEEQKAQESDEYRAIRDAWELKLKNWDVAATLTYILRSSIFADAMWDTIISKEDIRDVVKKNLISSDTIKDAVRQGAAEGVERFKRECLKNYVNH